ncbi:MAG: WD40 repeat domain-containing protein [Planctomycetia bacterium]|nr:WD40 repeat domain-containing protein [Planctomycetia bacterium]
MNTARKVDCPSCKVALSTAGLPMGKPFRCPECKSRVEYPTGSDTASTSSSSSVPWLAAVAMLSVLMGVGSWYFSKGWWVKNEVAQTKAGDDPKLPHTPSNNPTDNPGGGDGGQSGYLTPEPDQPGTSPQVMMAAALARPLDFKKPILLKGHRPESVIASLAFSSDGRRLASISQAGEVIIWDLVSQDGIALIRKLTQEELKHKSAQSFNVGKHLDFSADGKTLFTGSSGETLMWDVESTFGRHKFGKFVDQRHELILGPNGKTVVTERAAGEDGENQHGLIVWDLATGNSVFKIDYSKLAPQHVARYSPDGRLFALAERPFESKEEASSAEALAESKIRIFDLESKKELPAIGVAASQVVVLPNNRLLAWKMPTKDDKGPGVELWTIPSNGSTAQKQVMPEMAKVVGKSPDGETFSMPTLDAWYGHTVSPDGKRWAFFDGTGAIDVRDTSTLKSIARITGDKSRVYRQFIFSSDGASLVAASWTKGSEPLQILEFDAAQGAQRAQATIPLMPDPEGKKFNYVPVLAASPAHAGTVAVGLPDGSVLIQPMGVPSLKSWEIKADSPAVQNGSVQLITTTPRGMKALQATERASFPVEFLYREQHHLAPVALSEDGSKAAVRGLMDGEQGAIFLLDVAAGKELATVKLGPAAAPTGHMWFTSDQHYIVCDDFTVVDVAKAAHVPLTDNPNSRCLDLVPGDKLLAVGLKHEGTSDSKIFQLRKLDTLALEHSGLSMFEGCVHSLKYSPDGKRLAALIEQRNNVQLLLLDPTNGEQKTVLDKSEDMGVPQTQLAFSPDGMGLAAIINNIRFIEGKALSVYDMHTGRKRFQIAGDTEPVFLANGRLLGAPKVYDSKTGHLRLALEVHESGDVVGVHHVQAGCNQMAVGHVSGQVSLWELTRGVKLAEFKAHDGPIAGLVLSSDGNTLITVGKENKVKIWGLK